MDPLKLGNRRLLKLADHLDTADAEHRKNDEPTYRQYSYIHNCGTPACAMGHARKLFRMRRDASDLDDYSITAAERAFFHLDNGAFMNSAETSEVFGVHGCGNARTGKQAARYIRKFVKNRTPK